MLDASQNSSSGDYVYIDFAIFVGLNVDKFVGKIEYVSMAFFGIEKSRIVRSGDNNNVK